MNKYVKLTSLSLLLFAALNGCAVDKIEPPSTQGTTTTAAVFTITAQGAQAFSSLLQARDYFYTSTHIFRYLGERALGIMAADTALTLSPNTDIACVDGGTYEYSGTETSGTYDLTVTLSGCRENQFQYEGTMTVTGSPGSLSVRLGDSGNTLNIFYFNSDYSVLIAYLKAQASYIMTGTGTSSNASYSIAPGGSITAFDYFLLDTFTMNYIRTTTTYALSTDSVTGDQTVSIVNSGYFTETWASMGLTINLANFQIDRVKRWSAAAGAFTADDTSLAGTITFNYRPNSFCFEGMYTAATTTPIHTDYASNRTTLGALDLNSGGATAQYNGTGSIDVTVAGSGTQSFGSEYELMKQCDYCGLEMVLPPILPPPAAGSPVTLTGNEMTVTLTWYGGATSDMDTHMAYYSTTTPTGSDTPAWHVYYATGVECTEPSGIDFYGAVDVDGDGTCDVGLDFDDVQGYGPEHITALKLQTGYYVIYIHNFSLDTDPYATIYSSVHVGENVFAPYSATFNSGTPNYYPIADVRVNADGTIQVMAHDTALTPTPPYP